MKFRLITILLVIILSVVAVSVVAANNSAQTEAQLVNAGWLCGPPAGPPGHCFPPGTANRGAPARTIQVKVFDEAGDFLGTEILWHIDIYGGQPCPQDALLDLNAETGGEFPYIGCHRYPELTGGA
jgi:hypothetical protein